MFAIGLTFTFVCLPPSLESFQEGVQEGILSPFFGYVFLLFSLYLSSFFFVSGGLALYLVIAKLRKS